VRAFEERDISGVIDLHRRVFPLPNDGGTDRLRAYDAYFHEMFLDAPWRDGQPSLVYEDDDGTPIGFLGAMSRRMVLRDRPVQAVITSQFIVEPTRRATLAGIKLIRAVLAGPQDLTLADEASDISRRLWEGLGGTTALLYSLHWVRLLRPVQFAVARWGPTRRGAARVWIPLGRVVDAVAARLLDGVLRPAAPPTSGEELSGGTLAACVAEFAGDRTLRPEYDDRMAHWLLEMLARKPGCGRLQKVLVRTAAGEIAGWYLSCGVGGVREVLQVGARQERIGDVLDHLFAQAWHEGASAVVGRIDPRFASVFSDRGCVFRHRGQWMLIHSRDPELVRVIQRGDAFLTRLEGEWCLRFRAGYS